MPFMGDPRDQMESFAAGSSSTVSRGDKVGRSKQTINALQRKFRSAQIQEYVQQLPAEFRRQIAEYYEVLAE